jgi:site-specific recombinase XerD
MNHTSLHRAAPSMQPSSSLSRDVTEELRRYDEHLRDVRGLAESTRHQLALIIGRLLRQKFADRPIDIAKLRPEDISRFLDDQQGVSRSPSNASQLASALRSYFRYRTTCGDQVGELTTVISNPVHWKLASLPRALRPDEADRLLKSFAKARVRHRPLCTGFGAPCRRNCLSHD